MDTNERDVFGANATDASIRFEARDASNQVLKSGTAEPGMGVHLPHATSYRIYAPEETYTFADDQVGTEDDIAIFSLSATHSFKLMDDEAAKQRQDHVDFVVYNLATGEPIDIDVEVPTEPTTDLPAAFALHENYPNPFNPATTIGFDVPQRADVRLEVFDVAGRRIATVVDASFAPGRHTVSFDAQQLPSGVYFYRIAMGDFQQVRSMLLVK
jgi:hypothetical protein